jgi:hypothetical protein
MRLDLRKIETGAAALADDASRPADIKPAPTPPESTLTSAGATRAPAISDAEHALTFTPVALRKRRRGFAFATGTVDTSSMLGVAAFPCNSRETCSSEDKTDGTALPGDFDRIL